MRPLSVPADFIDDGVDQGGLAGSHGFVERVQQLIRRHRSHADATECLHHRVVAGTLHEHGGRHIGMPGRVLVGAAIDAVVVEDDHANRQVVAADGFHLHAGEPEGTVAFDGDDRFARLNGRRNSEPHADTHHAPGADIEALARLVHVDDRAGVIERVGALVHDHRIGTRLDDVTDHPQCAVEVHRRRALRERRRHLGKVLLLALRNGARPCRRRLRPSRVNLHQQTRHARADVANDRRGDRDVAVDFRRRDIDLDELLRQSSPPHVLPLP